MDHVLSQLHDLAHCSGTREQRARAAAGLIRLARPYRWVGLYDVTADEIAVIAWEGPANTVSLILKGASSGQASPQQLRAPLGSLADALQGVNRGKPHFFSWRNLITGHAADPRELRHIILVNPVLDFAQLQPGRPATEAIRAIANRLQLDEAHGVRIRLTGPVPLQDDQFATLAQRAGLIAGLALGAIILMLWFAVRSPWLIASILVTTLAGLVLTTGLGLALFQRFNIISVAFIPLFVGMGMDFGIQFSVRYRAERYAGCDVRRALVASGRTMGRALTLAAAAIGAGFVAFAPTPTMASRNSGSLPDLVWSWRSL